MHQFQKMPTHLSFLLCTIRVEKSLKLCPIVLFIVGQVMRVLSNPFEASVQEGECTNPVLAVDRLVYSIERLACIHYLCNASCFPPLAHQKGDKQLCTGIVKLENGTFFGIPPILKSISIIAVCSKVPRTTSCLKDVVSPHPPRCT